MLMTDIRHTYVGDLYEKKKLMQILNLVNIKYLIAVMGVCVIIGGQHFLECILVNTVFIG